MTAVVARWLLDASTFIHAVIVKHVQVLTTMRAPLVVPEYVYRQELVGERAREVTRESAEQAARNGMLAVERLSLADLQRIAALNPPKRKCSLGEISCAIIAERTSGGVLCDDHRAVGWMREHIAVVVWESIEHVLIAAAHALRLDEYALDECEQTLATNNYRCRSSLRNEFLMQRLNSQRSNF